MKYIAFYDVEEYENENRCVTPSTKKLVRYMAEVMSRSYPIEIVSPTRTLNKSGYYSGRISQLQEGVDLRHPPTFGVRTKVGRVFAIGYTQIWLFIYLMLSVKRGETLVVYHGLSYMFTVCFMKKIKKLRLILEVREIYADVNPNTPEKKRKKELQYLSQGDAYVVPTELLNEKINVKKKPYVVASGVYEKTDDSGMKWNDGLVHVVYAGTLDPQKGGAQNMIEATQFLPEQYHVHILGFGSEEEKKAITERIREIQLSSKAVVTYDGVLFGMDFEKYLQKCDIGVAPQDKNGKFNDTSFPSKILTYLSNGLEVVSSDIPAVRQSAVGDIVYYYMDSAPDKIAQAVQSVNLNNTGNAGCLMDNLDRKLRREITGLFKE